MKMILENKMKRIINNILWLVFDKIFILLLQFLVGVKIANYYGTISFGEYNYTLSDRYSFGIGKVEDVANLAVYLSSNEAKWITGQNYILDGGYI